VKKFLPELLIFSGIAILLFSYGPILLDEAVYRFKEYKKQVYSLDKSTHNTVPDSPFARLISVSPILIEPVNTDFAIVIEKIGVNAPVVRDVPVSDEDAYIEALKSGVAHASSAPYPSEEPGNVYLFAHSSINFWRLGKYAKVFNLLRKLEPGDNVNIFYENRQFTYEVINKEIYKGFNTYPLTRTTLEPILTLQTCDPPGTTFNRMVVTAQLKDVKPVESSK
jgi:sortase A